MNDARDALQNLTSKPAPDHYAMFGSTVAGEIRSIPTDFGRSALMTKIMQTILDFKQQYQQPHSHQPYQQSSLVLPMPAASYQQPVINPPASTPNYQQPLNPPASTPTYQQPSLNPPVSTPTYQQPLNSPVSTPIQQPSLNSPATYQQPSLVASYLPPSHVSPVSDVSYQQLN